MIIENFFYLLLKCIIIKKSNEKNDNFISYMELYQKLGLNDMQFSKEYVFHKLMWYIDLSLSKKKFFISENPKETFYAFNSEDHNYQKFILLIYAFLLQKDIFIQFGLFDSYTFFMILSKFFTEKYLYKIIKEADLKTLSEEYNEIFNQLTNVHSTRNLNDIIKGKKEENK